MSMFIKPQSTFLVNTKKVNHFSFANDKGALNQSNMLL